MKSTVNTIRWRCTVEREPWYRWVATGRVRGSPGGFSVSIPVRRPSILFEHVNVVTIGVSVALLSCNWVIAPLSRVFNRSGRTKLKAVYIRLVLFICFLLNSFFRQLPSVLTEWNSTKFCHTLGSEPDLQIHDQNLGSLPKNEDPKLLLLTVFDNFATYM